MAKQKLIIWDFDGVLADSEHLWIQNWVDTLEQIYHITLSEAEQKHYLEGKADKTKVPMLKQDFPNLEFDERFWTTLHQNEDKLIAEQLKLTPQVTDILEDTDFAHCVATGATLQKHNKKTLKLGLNKYFNAENTFTAYDVPLGKPAPDIFLFAAKKLGYFPSDCIVIEDSIVGIQAGIAANMYTIAFVGATGHNNSEYINRCIAEKANFISNSMIEIHKFLQRMK